MSHHPPEIANRRVVWGGLAWCVAVCFLCGCGAETYESRLKDTRAMFAHQELLNQNLYGAWSDQQSGISLRVPLHFEMLPPPAKPPATPGKPAASTSPDEEEDEEEEDEILDNRQPSYMNIGLPGLRGAFRAPLKAVGEGNTPLDAEGYLYVLSNHHLYDQPDQAKDFIKHVTQVLSEGLHKTVEDANWKDERFPPEGKARTAFVKSHPYRDMALVSEEPIAGYTREFSAYAYEQGDVQVVLLFVLPRDVEPAEKLAERVPLCLETLMVAGTKLLAPAAGGAPASTGTTGGF